MKIQITATIPPLPDGWEGTLDEQHQWISENITFEADGGFLAGQVGGSRPSSDVGLYVNGRAIEVWSGSLSKYVPIAGLPIGCVIPFFGSEASVPTGYYLCDGREILKEQEKDLWTAISATDEQRRRTGDATDKFRVPDLRGRTVFGAGTGQYYGANNVPLSPGAMKNRQNGASEGQEWLIRNAKAAPGAPTIREGLKKGSIDRNKTNISDTLPPAVNANWIIRAI